MGPPEWHSRGCCLIAQLAATRLLPYEEYAKESPMVYRERQSTMEPADFNHPIDTQRKLAPPVSARIIRVALPHHHAHTSKIPTRI
jgi:hypothetical protein